MGSDRYARVLKLVVVPVVGVFDEDGHLLGEHALTEVQVYYPFQPNVESILRLAEQRVQETIAEVA